LKREFNVDWTWLILSLNLAKIMSQNAFILLIVTLIALILSLLIVAHRQWRSHFEKERKRKLISQMIRQPLQARPLDFYSDPYLRQFLYAEWKWAESN